MKNSSIRWHLQVSQLVQIVGYCILGTNLSQKYMDTGIFNWYENLIFDVVFFDTMVSSLGCGDPRWAEIKVIEYCLHAKQLPARSDDSWLSCDCRSARNHHAIPGAHPAGSRRWL